MEERIENSEQPRREEQDPGFRSKRSIQQVRDDLQKGLLRRNAPVNGNSLNSFQPKSESDWLGQNIHKTRVYHP